MFAHLIAVFNQLAHRCGNLTVSALELQGSDILMYCVMYTSVFSVLQITVCIVLQKV